MTDNISTRLGWRCSASCSWRRRRRCPGWPRAVHAVHTLWHAALPRITSGLHRRSRTATGAPRCTPQRATLAAAGISQWRVGRRSPSRATAEQPLIRPKKEKIKRPHAVSPTSSEIRWLWLGSIELNTMINRHGLPPLEVPAGDHRKNDHDHREKDCLASWLQSSNGVTYRRVLKKNNG